MCILIIFNEEANKILYLHIIYVLSFIYAKYKPYFIFKKIIKYYLTKNQLDLNEHEYLFK